MKLMTEDLNAPQVLSYNAVVVYEYVRDNPGCEFDYPSVEFSVASMLKYLGIFKRIDGDWHVVPKEERLNP